MRLTTLLCFAIATVAILLHGSHAQPSPAPPTNFCLNSTVAPIVDSLDYRQGDSTFYSIIQNGEALGESFITGATTFAVKVTSVSVLLANNNDTSTNNTGELEIWTDNDAGFPDSLPSQLLGRLGPFSLLTSTPVLITLDVSGLDIFLQPSKLYWFVVRCTAGGVRWSYSDFAFQFGCPPETEGRIDGRYAFSDADPAVAWDNVSADNGFISFFAIERSCTDTQPTAAPTPVPSVSIVPPPLSPPPTSVPSIVPPPISPPPTPIPSIVPPPISLPPTPLPSGVPGRAGPRARSSWW
jgi:hypothetical protein